MPRSFLSFAALAAFSTLVHLTPASAETTLCTEITALPITITVQGVYCLKKNLNVNLATGNAITVNAGNVVIDFNDFRINNQAAATTEANGVFAQDRKNITLRNGFVRGFFYGILLAENVEDSSASHLVENMKIADSTHAGVWVQGDNSVVRDNRVIDTGGNAGNQGYGIVLWSADDGVVSGNLISGVTETSLNYGILVRLSDRVHVAHNTVNRVDGSAFDVGLYALDTDAVTATGNRVVNEAGSGEFGINGGGANSHFACTDNIVGGYATALQGCAIDLRNDVLFN